MKILIIGSSSKEHALVWKIAQSKKLTKIFVAPGNPGCAQESKTTNIEIMSDNFNKLIAFAKHQAIDCVIPGTESSLISGITDQLQSVGITCFGPTLAAARLGGSTLWTQSFVLRHGIPVASHSPYAFSDSVKQSNPDITLSLSTLIDGYHILPLGLVRKYKRRDSSLVSPQTTGMAAFSDSDSGFGFGFGFGFGSNHSSGSDPSITPESIQEKAIEQIIRPCILGMLKEGYPFMGFLHTEIHVTDKGEVQLVEFKCCLEDLESQVILPRLGDDLLQLIKSTLSARLDNLAFQMDPRKAFVLTLTSKGYPESYETGKPISGLSSLFQQRNSDNKLPNNQSWKKIFHSGTRNEKGVLVTNGGRVLCITVIDQDLQKAKDLAYATAHNIQWDGKYFREDLVAG